MGDIVEIKNANTVDSIKEDTVDFEALEVVESEIPYNKIVDFIEFVRVNSFSKNDGMYHEYLMDYSEAVAILTMYTNCNSYNFSFDETMRFIHSEKWAKIKEELGDKYICFHNYVMKEIEYTNAPLRYADNLMKNAANAIEKLNIILDKVDIEALNKYDFSKIINAIDAIEINKE